MVKNTHGGSKHKSQARKDTQQSNIQNNIEPNGPNERWAHVTKLYGNGMCEVITHDDSPLTLTCHIRGKFRGKNKKHNNVSLNSIIIIGLRDWETQVKNCDLIAISNSFHHSNDSNDLNTDSFHFSHHLDHNLHHNPHHNLDHNLQHNLQDNLQHIDFDIDYI
jgi:translation initiation factor IF-1